MKSYYKIIVEEKEKSLVEMIRNRQSHIVRGIPITIIERKVEGKDKRKTDNDVIGQYDEGERAEQRGEWRHWMDEPAAYNKKASVEPNTCISSVHVYVISFWYCLPFKRYELLIVI